MRPCFLPNLPCNDSCHRPFLSHALWPQSTSSGPIVVPTATGTLTCTVAVAIGGQTCRLGSGCTYMTPRRAQHVTTHSSRIRENKKPCQGSGHCRLRPSSQRHNQYTGLTDRTLADQNQPPGYGVVSPDVAATRQNPPIAENAHNSNQEDGISQKKK